jgi:type VI protein secretion system component VasA
MKNKNIWYFEFTPYSYPDNHIYTTFNNNKSETWIIYKMQEQTDLNIIINILEKLHIEYKFDKENNIINYSPNSYKGYHCVDGYFFFNKNGECIDIQGCD